MLSHADWGAGIGCSQLIQVISDFSSTPFTRWTYLLLNETIHHDMWPSLRMKVSSGASDAAGLTQVWIIPRWYGILMSVKVHILDMKASGWREEWRNPSLWYWDHQSLNRGGAYVVRLKFIFRGSAGSQCSEGGAVSTAAACRWDALDSVAQLDFIYL